MDVTTAKFLNIKIKILRSGSSGLKHRVKLIRVSLKSSSSYLQKISLHKNRERVT